MYGVIALVTLYALPLMLSTFSLNSSFLSSISQGICLSPMNVMNLFLRHLPGFSVARHNILDIILWKCRSQTRWSCLYLSIISKVSIPSDRCHCFGLYDLVIQGE